MKYIHVFVNTNNKYLPASDFQQ